MRRFQKLMGILMPLLSLCFVPGVAAQADQGGNKPVPAGAKAESPKPDLSLNEARMIVKEIPSVDIKATLGRWKLAEPELTELRKWSSLLVENPSRTDFLPQWADLVNQAAARSRQIKDSDVTSLIRMVMLAAYEDAQKYLEPDPAGGQPNLYKELQDQIRQNLIQARQLQAVSNYGRKDLASSERRDPTSGSRFSLPAYQRTLRKCDVLAGPPQKLECKEVLVSTAYELDDYISTSEAQLKKAEEAAKKGGGVSESRQEKRREILYALSDVAKAMHDSAIAELRRISGNGRL
jgi:hypothetical protein